MGDWMVKTQAESMQAKAAHRVVAIAIFYVSTNGVSQVGGMDANLVLAACLQLELDKRMVCRTI